MLRYYRMHMHPPPVVGLERVTNILVEKHFRGDPERRKSNQSVYVERISRVCDEPSGCATLRVCSRVILENFADTKVCNLDAPVVVDEKVVGL
jgi:hypothetical protein